MHRPRRSCSFERAYRMTALIFDTETTGLVEPQVIEAAWLKINNPVDLKVVDSFRQRYTPTKKIELGALSTHHIMDEDLADCPMHFDFALSTDVLYLIGHNIDYDWKVVGEPNVKRICTLALSRSLWPELDAHRQSAMLYHLERASARDRLKGAHSASCDVENCLVILRHIVVKLGVETWEQLWVASEKARVPVTMPFGKWKGTPIADVPKDYVRWLLGTPDVDPYLRKAFEK